MNIVYRNTLPAAVRRAAFDGSFERLMNSVFSDPSVNPAQAAVPPISVTETQTAFEVEAELPGVRKEDVKIAIDAGRVSITAEAAPKAELKEGEKVLLAERGSRKYSRSFNLPEGLDEARIDARLENGILSLTLPKKPVVQPVQITVR
jgi:HSP20 family protein